MKYQEYNPVKGSGCVIRTFMKLLDKEYDVVKEELEGLTKELNYKDINEVEVFDEYFRRNHYIKENKEILVSKLNYTKGKYGVFCYKDDDYHMFSVINGVIYDKDQKYKNMIVISIYEYEE